MKRILSSAAAVMALGAAHVSLPPFPVAIFMQHGLTTIKAVKPPAWGTAIAASDVKWITHRSLPSTVEWAVWAKDGGPETFPIVSTDHGHTWTVAGPMLATNRSGGAIFGVTRVFSEGPTSVVMVSNAVIDVTTDSGHHWFQFLNPRDDWSMTRATVPAGTSGIGLRIAPAPNSKLPKSDYAVYRLVVSQHRWLRISESVTATVASG